MTDVDPLNEQSPTLQPVGSAAAPNPADPRAGGQSPTGPAPGWPAGPGGPMPPGAAAHVGSRPPEPARGGSAFKVVLLILGGLLLLGSLVLNALLLMDIEVDTSYATSLATTVLRSGDSDQTVALYHVEGIIDGRAVALFNRFYRSVADDRDVRAVVLRVNSPGGGVTASDQICQMVKDLKSSGKTVVVSMGSLAASGGYYISAPADEIYAEATTLTGSIGVLAGWVVLKGTLDKIGAEAVVIKSSHAEGWKDSMSSFKRPHDYQRRHLRGLLDKMQDRFEKVVKAGRGKRLRMRTQTLMVPGEKEGARRELTETAPLNGKIYLADEALGFGLIDAIGYKEDAIDRAAKLAQLDSPRLVLYSRRMTLMEQLLSSRAEQPRQIGVDLLDRIQTPRMMMIWKMD